MWGLQQVVPLLLIAVFGAGPAGVGILVALGGLVLSLIASTVRWMRFSYQLQGGSLVIEQGLISRSRRVIPLERIQAVDLIRPLRHRAFGVVQVRIEAIGGSETEGQLEALDVATATALQQQLRDSTPSDAATSPGRVPDPGAATSSPAGWQGGVPVPGGSATAEGAGAPAGPGGRTRHPARVLTQVRPRDLVVAGLTGGRVGVLAVILGGVQQVAGDRIDEAFRLIPTDLGILAITLLVALAAVVVFVLSIVATVVSYWGFRLTDDGVDLRLTRGLLEQRAETIPLRRIQSLRIEQNLLRRWMGLAAVKADLAGRAGGGGSGTGLLLPIGPVAEAEALIAVLLGSAGAGRTEVAEVRAAAAGGDHGAVSGGGVAPPHDAPVHAPLQPAEARSRRRWLVRGLLLALPAAALGVPGVLLLDWPVWLPALTGLLGAVVGVPLWLAAWRALGWASVEGVLVARTGVVVRRRVHVPVARVQAVALSATPFQQRLGLVDVEVGIARSGGWEGPRLREVDRDTARALTARTVHEAVARSRRAPGAQPPRPGADG